MFGMGRAGPLQEGAGCASEGSIGASGSERSLGLRAGNTVSTQASINAPGEDHGQCKIQRVAPCLSAAGQLVRACMAMEPAYFGRPSATRSRFPLPPAV